MDFAIKFDQMPPTSEKSTIEGLYIRNEISLFEFYVLATKYISG